jgi:predicted nucleic acid-binding protein
MKIVLDTNVLVSGLLQPLGPSGQIVRLVASGELVLCYDPRMHLKPRYIRKLLQHRAMVEPLL